jgi:hypothetical protein
MVVAIIGSRNFLNYGLLKAKMEELNLPVTKVVSGCAGGADTLGENWAKEMGLDFQGFPAKWDGLEAEGAVIKKNKFGKDYNANAGFQRNKDIINACEAVVAFWDMKSKGSKDSLSYAHKTGKKWYIIDVSKFVVN